MKSLILIVLFSSYVFSAVLGVVVIEDRRGMISKGALLPIEKSLKNELSYYSGGLEVNVLLDVDPDFKINAQREGFAYMQRFATEHNIDAVAVLEYKGAAKAIIVKLFINDGTNKAKNTSVKYNMNVKKFLPKIISNKIVRLLIETGQLHENKRYL